MLMMLFFLIKTQIKYDLSISYHTWSKHKEDSLLHSVHHMWEPTLRNSEICQWSSLPVPCHALSTVCVKPYTWEPPRSGGSTLFPSLSLLVHPVVGWPLGSQKRKRVAFLCILQSGFPCNTLCAIRLSSVSWHFKILFWQNVKHYLEATAEAGNWAERIKNINIYFI